MQKHIIRGIIGVLLGAGILSCSGKEEEAPVVKVQSVAIDQSDMTLTEGESVNLSAKALPENAEDKTISWSSSDERVVMVSSNGKAMALSIGKAVVTAKCGDKSDFITITVEAKVVPVTGVSLDKTQVAIKVGESETLTPTITPEDATNKKVSWISSNDEVATVEDGKVVGVKPGSVTITVTTEDGAKTAECPVTVKSNLAPSVTIDASHISAISVVLMGKANLESTTSSDLKVGFQYSKSAGILPSNSITVEALDADAAYNYTASITGLEPDTKYYFRSFVRQNGQDTYGETKEFATKELSSMISTVDNTKLTAVSTVLKATLDLTDVQFSEISFGFYYGLGSVMDSKTNAQEDSGELTADIKKLSPATVYNYQVYLILDQREYRGEIKSFSTKDVSSIIETAVASEIVDISAQLNARLHLADVLYDSFEYGFLWGISEGYLDRQTKVNTINEGAFWVTLEYLSPGTRYWFKSYVIIDNIRYDGEVKSFLTWEAISNGIQVDKSTAICTAEGGSFTLKVISREAWSISIPEEADSWLSVSPITGAKGTTDVRVAVSPLNGKTRTAIIYFLGNRYSASTTIVQEGTQAFSGDGSKAKPFSPSEAYAWVMANLEDGKTTPTSQKFYVAGKIHKISVKNDVTYDFAHAVDLDGKNIYKATFFISDDGESSKTDFEAYQVYYLGQRVWREGDDDIQVGDDVVIYGQLKRYQTTAETGGSYDYLYSLNGETVGKAPAEDISKYETKTIQEFINLAKTDTYYVISGLVSGFQLEGNPTQCTLTDETGSLTMYGVSDMSAFSGVKNDGTLTIAAKYKKYEKNGNVTHEAVDCIFGSFVEGTSAEPKGSGTLADPYNPAGAIAYIKSLSSTPSENEVYIKGKIASIKNEFDAEHGTAVFDISEDGTMKTTFTCYSVKFLENKDWVDGNTQIKKGDEVIVHSKVTVYNDVYETLSDNELPYKGYIYSLNGATSEMIVIKSFTETETGVSAEWTAPEGTKSFSVKLYKESVAEANLVKSETATENKIDMTVTLEPGTKYILSVSAAAGETTIEDSAELTSSTPAASNEIDFTKAPNKGTPSESKVEWENDYITVTLTKETSTTKANNYLGGANAHTRVYKDQKMTFAVKSGKTIKSIVLESTSAAYASTKMTWTDATSAVADAKITVTPSEGRTEFSVVFGQATRLNKLTVNAE